MKTKKIQIQKPFSVEEWENGAKVETRDGRSVRILCTDMKSVYDIVGLAELDGAEVVMTWLANGRYLHPGVNPSDNERDLVIVEEVEEPERWADDESATVDGWFINPDSEIVDYSNGANAPSNYNLFATEKQAKSALAMARISQLMAHDERYGGVVADEEWIKPGVDKYGVIRCKNAIKTEWFNMSYCFLAFHTPEQRELFLSENARLVKDYLMID